jgi:hypothetical protein
MVGAIQLTACINDNFLRLVRGPPVLPQPYTVQNLATWLIPTVTGCPLSKLLPFTVLYGMFVLACVLLTVYRLAVRHASMVCRSVVLL